MSHLLFLTVAPNEHPIDSSQPLSLDDLRSVSICHIRPGASREEFMEVRHFILSGQDDLEDFCAAMHAMCFSEPEPPFIFSFDLLFLIRRIAGYCIRRKCRFIPAVWYCGPHSRCYDIVNYLTADKSTTALELLQHCKIPVLPVWEPHKDCKLDMKYLIEVSDCFNLINEKLSADIIGTMELVATPAELPAVSGKKKAKMLKQSV